MNSVTSFVASTSPHNPHTPSLSIPSHLIHTESAGPDVHDLETKLNGYVRLYTDSQSEVEKLKLDLRRFEQNSEAEKVRPRDI
jgi:hypothetical protein